MNIIAVVVTYNRIELLKRNIRCLQQNKPVSSIIIVNNGSTDGTTEWLASQKELTVINQPNVGGAGGFYTGIQHAYNAHADWIWCMDDDVFPRVGAWRTCYGMPTTSKPAFWLHAGYRKERSLPKTSKPTT